MTTILSGATHRGSPFVGRTRELGLLGRLMTEGLHEVPNLVWVAGPTGSGRRRLIREALRLGPECEWVDLAPGGVGPDLPRWIRTEALDLIRSYPKAPVPSWALHVLAHHAPSLAAVASVPAFSREPLPAENAPELLGAAVGAFLRALTYTGPVVIEAGLWPAFGGKEERRLAAVHRALRVPGVVMLAAIDATHRALRRRPDVHAVRLKELPPEDLETLVRTWSGEGASWGGWLHRVTGGLPLYIHEVVRWLEETGALAIDDETRRIRTLLPREQWPLPMGLAAVLENRFRRLPPPARYLLDLLAGEDGRLDLETLRARYEGRDDGFDEALAVLRRRAFLLRRTARHPLATATPFWRGIATPPSRRRFRRRKPTGTPPPLRAHQPPPSLLHRLDESLRTIRATMESTVAAAPVTDLTALLLATRRRRGPVWDGLRGRIALLMAFARLRRRRRGLALAWTRWGRRRLDAEIHPNLRRSLGLFALRLLEKDGRPVEASALRLELLEESLFAGHLVTAALLRAAAAEGLRRIGRLEEARTQAARAEAELEERGLPARARLARFTRIQALVDGRRLEEAARLLRRRTDAVDYAFSEEHRATRCDLLENPPETAGFFEQYFSHSLPGGWNWGLEDAELPGHARAVLVRAAAAIRRGRGNDGNPADLEHLLEVRGYATDRADLCELRLAARLAEDPPRPLEAPLAAAAEAAARLGDPARMRHLASALLATPAAETPAFDRLFRPHLLAPHFGAGPAADRPPSRLFLMGRPRLETRGRERPLALRPEWWIALVGSAAACKLLGRPIDVDLLRRVLAEAGEEAADPEARLAEANHILWGGAGGPGGFRRDGSVILWDRSGLWCDTALLETPTARSSRGPRAPVTRGHSLPTAASAPGPEGFTNPEPLLAAAGPFLGTVDSPLLDEARALAAVRVREALARRLEQPETIGGDAYVAWLEGAGRITDLRDLLGSRLRRLGRPRAAHFLRPPPASP